MLGIDVKKLTKEITEEVTRPFVEEIKQSIATLHVDLQKVSKLLEKKDG